MNIIKTFGKYVSLFAFVIFVIVATIQLFNSKPVSNQWYTNPWYSTQTYSDQLQLNYVTITAITIAIIIFVNVIDFGNEGPDANNYRMKKFMKRVRYLACFFIIIFGTITLHPRTNYKRNCNLLSADYNYDQGCALVKSKKFSEAIYFLTKQF